MNGGYAGKLLFVDLTRERIDVQDLNEDLARNFIGGYGIGARVLYTMMKAGVDPLGPGNILGFAPGPLTGTGAPLTGRYTVVCKSPVNSGWNDNNSGGHFGPELKKAGFDAVFISGAAARPVYLWIKDGYAEIKDAQRLWGLDCRQARDLLLQELGDNRLRVAAIGLAGEKKSLMAAIINDGHRAAARGGPGAVMGSKNLKAVVARGTGKVKIANADKFKEASRTINDSIKNGPMAPIIAAFSQQGTGMGNVYCAMTSDSPIKNWGGSVVDFNGENLDVNNMDSRFKVKSYGCANCPIACGADYAVNDGAWPVGETNRPEYETMAAFGSLCLNDNYEAIIKCNDICNQYGLDTISTGATIAWAIECYESGLLTLNDTGGLELTWGNAKNIVALTQSVADQTGFGSILALGSAAAARKLNKGFEYLQTVRGVELPMHDPRLAPAYARTYQLDPTPARHTKGGLWLWQAQQPAEKRYIYDGTGDIDREMTATLEFLDIAGMCQFIYFPGVFDAAMELMEAATGWTFGKEERLAAVMRALHMRQAFSLREGLSLKDAVLPNRATGRPPLAAGPTAGVTVESQALADNFCEAVGWDKITGQPRRESLERLGGMDDVIRNLYGR
jgi:aldehyde:ferredoxin oxidoreductase